MPNNYQLTVSAEEKHLLEEIRKRRYKFGDDRIRLHYESGFIDGYLACKEYLSDIGQQPSQVQES